MFRLSALPLAVGAALLLASCSTGHHEGPTNPTALVSGSSMSIRAQALAPAQTTTSVACPIATPFITPFFLTVTPTGMSTVVVTSITTQFRTNAGNPAAQVTLPMPVPTVQFGTALDQAKNALNFSFDVCTLGAGTVIITVQTHTMTGQNGSASVAVPVH